MQIEEILTLLSTLYFLAQKEFVSYFSKDISLKLTKLNLSNL